MTIKDRVYGDTNIDSVVIIRLIKSKPVQRLKEISQFGIPDRYYHIKNYSRYEHSLGVMILLKKLGASEEEQIAGLLHDVSHTAFSHVIDWVVGDGKNEDYQDLQHRNFVKNSEIPAILREYSYRTERIVDERNFGLLERDLPNICADRIDYSIREFTHSTSRVCVEGLLVSEGRIIFKNKSPALIFSKNFLRKQMGHWGSFEAASRYRIFADILRHALRDAIITEDDFWQNDTFIVDKIKASGGKKIQEALRLLESRSLSELPKSGITVYKKFRYVDPLFVSKGDIRRLSEVDKGFAQELTKARKANRAGIKIPLVAL